MVPMCIWNIIYGEKSIIIFYSLLYLMFIHGLKLQHLKTNVKNELMVSTEWAKWGKKINLFFFSLVTSTKTSSNCSEIKIIKKKKFKRTDKNRLLRFCTDPVDYLQLTQMFQLYSSRIYILIKRLISTSSSTEPFLYWLFQTCTFLKH